MIRLRHEVRKGAFELDVDVEIPATGVTGVFGASGSGKTTLLRCIAGLEGDRGLPVHKRNVGYVFQQPTLFSHLDVKGNIEYGAKRATSQRVDRGAVLNMLGIEAMLDRRVDTLSGGEAQRVAIAAALLRSPELVLMDEPLASLDRRRKDELLPYFDRLHDELSVPAIYVSHDIDEISRLCDHLLILDEGRIVAQGSLFDVLSRVDIPQLAGRNAGVVLWAVPVDHEDGLTRFGFSDGCACALLQTMSVLRASGPRRPRSSMCCAPRSRKSTRSTTHGPWCGSELATRTSWRRSPTAR